jgi:hypothetical protein
MGRPKHANLFGGQKPLCIGRQSRLLKIHLEPRRIDHNYWHFTNLFTPPHPTPHTTTTTHTTPHQRTPHKIMISTPYNKNISSAKENTQTEIMCGKEKQSASTSTPVKRPLQTTIDEVTPSPPSRKRLAPTSSTDSDSSGDSPQYYDLQRCDAWSEDSQEEAAIAIAQKSRKRARVSFNVPLLRKTLFDATSFALVTPMHWNDLVSDTDNLQTVLLRATEKE